MNIFQKLSSLTTSRRDYQDVAVALETLRKSGKPVTVKFEGDTRSYSSRVTAFNEEHRIFVLSNVFPPAPDETFVSGRHATISSTDNEKSISLETVCVEPLVPGQQMGYEMKVKSALTVVEFEKEFNFGIQQTSPKVKAVSPERKVVGL